MVEGLDDAGSPSFAQRIQHMACKSPDQVAMTFVDYTRKSAAGATDITYAQLDREARRLAAELGSQACSGDRAAILCSHSAEYIFAFVACLYSGVIAVPLYAVDGRRLLARLLNIINDAQPAFVMADQASSSWIAAMLEDLRPQPRILHVERREDRAPVPEPVHAPAACHTSAASYLQYTSGSTRQPAGIQVTDANIQCAAAQLQRALDVRAGSSLVSWLPFFHDMGLLFGVILPLLAGVPVAYLSPFAFVQQPRRWLSLISERQATHSVTPNFGLDHCVDRIPPERTEGLDLSSLRVLANGSEAIRAASLERFSSRFVTCGFRHQAHTPGYGLAEATLIVTAGTVDSNPRVVCLDRAHLAKGLVRILGERSPDSYELVSCGRAVDQEVRIVDPGSCKEVRPAEIGEIWVRGPNVCAGIWGQSELSSGNFAARLEGEDGDEGWLRTGDLGFMFDGEVYIAGRLKDVLVLDGRNHHPLDIETTVEAAHPEVRRGHVVAFSYDDGAHERLVIVTELASYSLTPEQQQRLRASISRSVVMNHEVAVRNVVLVGRGRIPKTTSGKLQRRACRDLYLHAGLTDHFAQPAERREA